MIHTSRWSMIIQDDTMPVSQCLSCLSAINQPEHSTFFKTHNDQQFTYNAEYRSADFDENVPLPCTCK